MGAHRNRQRTLPVVFFCSLGWVCAGEVIGQTAADSTAGGMSATPAASTPAPAPAPGSGETRGSSLFSADVPAEIPTGQNVGINTYGQIDLHVKDLEVAKVLQLLSIQSQRNIIASKNVAGSVSADLYGVDFYEALDAVLHPNGFGYREQGNFIYVYTTQELKEIQDQNRKAVTRVLRLNYINAADASAFVSPMLSGSGAISVSGEVTQSLQPTISDAGTNSFAHADTLVIRDYEENVNEVLEVLKELDIRPKQVLVEATILQARLTENNALGVDFAIFTDLNIESFANPLTAVTELITGDAISEGANSGTVINSTSGNVAAGNSSVKIGIVGSDAAIFIRALQQVTDTTVLSNPKLTVLNRQRADLLVGERLGYLSTTTSETSTTSTVEFLDVGTQLTVRPFVSSDNFIRLELRPSVSDGSTAVQAGQIIPTETTSELTTNIIVKNGQTIVLGGLFKEDITRDRRQTPIMGDIPILGEAFKGRDDNVERNEVIFLVRPTIIKDESLAKMGSDLHDDAMTHAMSAREGLLPWSRTKLTYAHMRDARKHMEEGNEKKALWSTNMALSLDPTMLEAIRMREQLTGQKVYRSSGSILQKSVDKYISESMVEEGAAAPVEGDKAAAEAEAGEAPVQDVSEPIVSAPLEAPKVDNDAQPQATTEPATEAVESTATEPQETATEPQAAVTPESTEVPSYEGDAGMVVTEEPQAQEAQVFEPVPAELEPQNTTVEVPTEDLDMIEEAK